MLDKVTLEFNLTFTKSDKKAIAIIAIFFLVLSHYFVD